MPKIREANRTARPFLLLLILAELATGGFLASVPIVSAESKDAPKTGYRFDFGPGKVESGYVPVLPTTVYTKERGYGFEPGSAISGVDRGGPDALRRDFCTSENPFFFTAALPEGNYRVTVILGDEAGESTTTVKAELRRLMLENVRTTPGTFETRAFTVNIRTPKISTGGEVRLKDREKTTEWSNWDDKLTLEFNGARPCLCALEIARVDDVPPFDPSHPDPVATFRVPASPLASPLTPLGN